MAPSRLRRYTSIMHASRGASWSASVASRARARTQVQARRREQARKGRQRHRARSTGRSRLLSVRHRLWLWIVTGATMLTQEWFERIVGDLRKAEESKAKAAAAAAATTAENVGTAVDGDAQGEDAAGDKRDRKQLDW
ncbi:hypothetical protein EDB83DRAFT_2315076 [Lactarius deliciosus]|nr:hypothetical protein EDB83DRAFT_2315076 [Lactarius deliciosus]